MYSRKSSDLMVLLRNTRQDLWLRVICRKEVKDFLSNNFDMKDLGVTDVILNIKLLIEDNGGVTLLQSHYMVGLQWKRFESLWV